MFLILIHYPKKKYMNVPRFNSGLKHLLASSFLGMSVYAATIVDTELYNSPSTSAADLINPDTISLTAASGSTAEATVEAISGLNVIQDFSASLTGGTNVFSFTDPSLPDIQTSFTGGVISGTGGRLSNTAFITSGSDSMRIQGDRTGTFVMVIDFGVWSGSSFSSSGVTVDAAAFTLRGNAGEFSSIVAEFLDASSSVISTQTAGGVNSYFGLESTTPIGSIVLTFNPISSNDGPLGFDDLAFAVSGGGGTGGGGTPEEVIVDNLEAEFDGTWDSSTWADDYYGSNYQFNVTGTGADKVRWRPDLVAGDYDVYIWLPDGAASRPDDAPFTVYHASGSTTYLVDEKGAGGAWVLLGTHTFNAGTNGYVELTDDASDTHVIADAVRFFPSVGVPPAPVANPSFSPSGGTYSSAQTVSISTAKSGASIRYTTNGSTPTATSGTLYTGSFTVSATSTLKAIAYKSGMSNSSVTSASFTITTGGTAVYGATGAWPSDSPAAGATATATYSSLSALEVALRTASPGDVFHLSSFTQSTDYDFDDATAKSNLDSFGSSDLNVLVRPAPGSEVILNAGIEVFLPNITWAYFQSNGFFAFRQGSDHSRMARLQMGPSAKLSVTASSYHEFVECLKPVRGEDGDTMQVTSRVISGVLQGTPKDILWDSCWLEGNTVVTSGQHSDTIQWLCSDGTMWFRNCYIGPAGNNATFQFNLTHQPSGLDYAVFDLDTCFMGGAEIYGNGNVLGSFHTPAYIRNVEFPHLKSRGDPFVLPAVVEDCLIQASDITIHADLGGGSMSSLYPDNTYSATIVWPTFVEPSWWD